MVKGYNWLCSTWVQSCLRSFLTGLSNIAVFFKVNHFCSCNTCHHLNCICPVYTCLFSGGQHYKNSVTSSTYNTLHNGESAHSHFSINLLMVHHEAYCNTHMYSPTLGMESTFSYASHRRGSRRSCTRMWW